MGEVETLMNKLCPNNVEYKLFNEVAFYIRGVSYNKTKEVNDGGEGYKLLRANNITLSSNTLNFEDIKTIDYSVNVKENQMLIKDDILICAGSGSKEHIGKVAYIDENIDYTFGGFMGVIRTKKEILNPRYMFHIMTSPIFKEHLFKVSNSSTINNINNDTWKNFRIPVPTLEIQKEIVHILDSFTSISKKLSEELIERKKQFQYYIDYYYSLDNKEVTDKNIFKLEDLGTIIRGKRFVHADAVEENGIPAIHYGELYTYYGISATKTKSQIRKDIPKTLRYAEKNDVIIVGAGENNTDIGVGVAWLGDYKVAIHDACYIFHTENNSNVEPKYLSYYLRSTMYHQQIKKYVSEGKICALSAQGIGKSSIYLPSIIEQKRIVEILDTFDKLINDKEKGILAEFEYRQKQYEYYRLKLLSFNRKEKENFE